MTVNTTSITSGPYPGNDIADEFDYNFRVEDKTQLIVYETDDAGFQTTLTVDTDYMVNDIGVDAGGTVTRVAGALPTGYVWYIRSNYKQTQGTAFSSQGGFFPDVHEAAMDKLTFLVQQITDILNRSMRLSESYTGDAITALPDPESQKFLRWKSDLSGFENTAILASSILVGLDVGDVVQLIDDGSGNGVFPEDQLRIGTAIGNLAKLIDDGSGNGVFPEDQLRIGTAIGEVLKLVDAGAGVPALPLESKATLTTAGDILYASAANVLARLAKGTSGQVLTMGAVLPEWADPSGGGGLVLLAEKTASSDTTIDFDSLINSTYDEYEIRFYNVIPATDAVNLFLRTSTDGGSTYDSGASDYAWSAGGIVGAGGVISDGSSNSAAILITASNTVGSDTNETGVSGTIRLIRPSVAQYFALMYSVKYTQSNGDRGFINGMGERNTSADVDAVRFLFSTGNIESGVFYLYGINKTL